MQETMPSNLTFGDYFQQVANSRRGNCCYLAPDRKTLRFLPEKAATLAYGILDELIKEVNVRPLPIVLAAFSGGSKGCLYKILQLVEGKCEGQHRKDNYQLLKECLSGQIYDSSPSDFTSELGTQFVLHPSVLKLSRPPRLVAWMAKAFASGLDALFINRFEAERAEYWQILYSSFNMGPFLIFCSEDDELAPYKIVCGFARRIQGLGGDVNLIKWSSSPHVAHYRYHRVEYKAATAEFLAKASLNYSRRQQLHRAAACDKIPESICNMHVVADSSNEGLKREGIGPSDHLLCSMEFRETIDGVSFVDEHKGTLFQLPSIKPHGILSQILFDVCVPKNIEGWDIKPISYVNTSHSFCNASWHPAFSQIKCIKRSRL